MSRRKNSKKLLILWMLAFCSMFLGKIVMPENCAFFSYSVSAPTEHHLSSGNLLQDHDAAFDENLNTANRQAAKYIQSVRKMWRVRFRLLLTFGILWNSAVIFQRLFFEWQRRKKHAFLYLLSIVEFVHKQDGKKRTVSLLLM